MARYNRVMRIAFSLLVPLLLAGCSNGPGAVYKLAPDDAISRLQNADNSGFIAAQKCGLPLTIATQALDAQTLKWSVASAGAEVAAFTVRIESAGAGLSRVVIALPKAASGGEIYDGDQKIDQPALQQPLRPAVAELVDAAMMQRHFDPAQIKGDSTPDDLCVLQRQAAGSNFTHVGGGATRPAPAAKQDWGRNNAGANAGGNNAFGRPPMGGGPAAPSGGFGAPSGFGAPAGNSGGGGGGGSGPAISAPAGAPAPAANGRGAYPG